MLEFSREQTDGNNLSTSKRDPKNTSGSISTTGPGAKPSTFEPLRASENYEAPGAPTRLVTGRVFPRSPPLDL